MENIKNLYSDIWIGDEVIHRDKGRDLPLRVFKPRDWKPQDRRAGIIFWFGGGFYKNDMDHFRMQSEYLAHRGMVVFTPDYRLITEEGVMITDCLFDGKCALHYVLLHADEFGVDPHRIVVSGGSAGGMIAAASVFFQWLDIREESDWPCAMVLFNPALELSGKNVLNEQKIIGESGEDISSEMDRVIKGMGKDILENPQKYSCFVQIRSGMPPALILAGTQDPLFPSCCVFAKKYRQAGNYIEVEPYDGCTHGFFNPGRSKNNFYYAQTLKRMEMFLAEQGLLEREEKK